jgi:hypothetical protein
MGACYGAFAAHAFLIGGGFHFPVSTSDRSRLSCSNPKKAASAATPRTVSQLSINRNRTKGL